ncbi:MAG: hypothetical protein ABL984_07090 [Pyrinomonadaceae bacterium]
MSGVSKDWIFVAVFFGAFIAVTVGEIVWLGRKLNVPMKKALTVVFLPNFLTITLGFFVTFVIFGILFAVAWDQNTHMPGGEAGMWVALVVAFGFPFLLMAAIRRLLIGGLRIEQIARPLPYALISTIIFFLVVFGIPAIYLVFL